MYQLAVYLKFDSWWDLAIVDMPKERPNLFSKVLMYVLWNDRKERTDGSSRASLYPQSM